MAEQMIPARAGSAPLVPAGMEGGAPPMSAGMVLGELWKRVPTGSQFGLIFGLAAAFAIGAGLIMWSLKPTMAPLFNRLEPGSLMAISEDLTRDQIPFEMDYRSGTVLVPRDRVAELRVRLGTTYGVAQDGTDRDRLVQDPPEPGTSTAWQNKRMIIALEKDLARDIARMQNIEAARVYLAVPRQSEFLRRQNAPRASVFVRPQLGRLINSAQAEGIRNLVAMSVANLDPAAVKIIGADGRAIGGPADPVAEQADKMLEMKERLENYYQEQVYELLSPIVGRDNMRVEVNAELDFSREDVTTITHESGERNVVSQEVSRQVGFGQMPAIGVPGALTNEPPGAGTVEPQEGNGAEGEPATPSSEREVKNMMPDKRTTRELKAPYRVQRISAAVLIDNRVSAEKKGKSTREPWPEEDLKKLEELTRQAIGYNDKRGDSLSVSNHSFVPPIEIAAPEPVPLWEQAWVWDLGRQLLVALVAILALFMIVRPALRSLSRASQNGSTEQPLGPDGQPLLPDGSPAANGAEAGSAEDGDQENGHDLLPPPPNVYGDILNLAKVLADEDPKRVASVIKEWVASDAE